MKNLSLKTGFVIMFFCVVFHAQAQSQPATTTSTSLGFDMTGFPQWTKDLRRGEIVAFGSFPFAMFFSSFFVDTFRMINNGWDRRYAPWPFKGAGAVGMTKQEQMTTLGIAAGGSVAIAVADYFIVRHRRKKLAQEIQSMPEGTPIIIRQPMGSSDSVTESGFVINIENTTP